MFLTASPHRLDLASQPSQTRKSILINLVIVITICMHSSSQKEQKQPTVKETGLIDDTGQTGQSADPVAQEPTDHDSDTSSADSNLLSDDLLTALAITGEKETPPCNHPDRGACVKSLICRRCRKAYCIHQSQYFQRHINLRCQGAATDGSKGASLGQYEGGHGSGSGR